jgi:hypothetical protein
MTTCKGILAKGACKEQVSEGEVYCVAHMYFKEYTDSIELVKCTKCKNMTDSASYKCCPVCYARIQARKDKIIIIKCAGIDRNGNTCRVKVQKAGDYCKNHVYMEDYTPEQLQNLSKCSGCQLYMYIEGGQKMCVPCHDRLGKFREDFKQSQLAPGKCQHDGCKFKASKEGYCMKHYNSASRFNETVIASGKKTCSNYVRGCRSILEMDYNYARCEDCLTEERKYDQTKRKGIVLQNEVNEIKKCVKCGKDIHDPIIDTHKNVSPKCKKCFELQQSIESKRPMRVRNWAEELKKNPARLIKIRENHAKHAHKWKLYRQNRIDKIGQIEFNRINTEKTAIYRKTHPDIMHALYAKYRVTPKYRQGFYQRRAISKKLDMTLTDDQWTQYFTGNCHYCGQRYEGPGTSLNGIDRTDNACGYYQENCVTCCTMCNMMKRNYSVVRFMNICEHVLGCNGFLETYEAHPDAFDDHLSGSLSCYKLSASKRHITFNLSQEQFDELCANECYMCGKPSSNTHVNGIDRVDNDVGYCVENCKACCFTCNILKKNLGVYDMISQLLKIYYHSIAKQCMKIDDPKDHNCKLDNFIEYRLTANEENMQFLISPYNWVELTDASFKDDRPSNDDVLDDNVSSDINPAPQAYNAQDELQRLDDSARITKVQLTSNKAVPSNEKCPVVLTKHNKFPTTQKQSSGHDSVSPASCTPIKRNQSPKHDSVSPISDTLIETEQEQIPEHGDIPLTPLMSKTPVKHTRVYESITRVKKTPEELKQYNQEYYIQQKTAEKMEEVRRYQRFKYAQEIGKACDEDGYLIKEAAMTPAERVRKCREKKKNQKDT